MLRIDHAIALYNARQLRKNKSRKMTDHYRKMTGTSLMRMVYPNYHDPNRKFFKFRNIKSIKKPVLDNICELTGVDPNFLFGYPSKHDKDFEKL